MPTEKQPGPKGDASMTESDALAMSWAERVADRSPVVQKFRNRGILQAKVIVDAAHRLIREKGSTFTTQELVREAGVALQTFYRYFEGKDQLLLAVIEDSVIQSCAAYQSQARRLQDPVARVHFYVTVALSSLGDRSDDAAGPRFITTEHWRLHRLYPNELALATQPYTDLLRDEIRAATEAGLLKSSDPDHDAWLVSQLVMSVYHHYAFVTTEVSVSEIGDRLWAFCLAALGGSGETTHPGEGGSTRRRTATVHQIDGVSGSRRQ
jgi:TetR/AcrR family transcriptional regulator